MAIKIINITLTIDTARQKGADYSAKAKDMGFKRKDGIIADSMLVNSDSAESALGNLGKVIDNEIAEAIEQVFNESKN